MAVHEGNGQSILLCHCLPDTRRRHLTVGGKRRSGQLSLISTVRYRHPYCVIAACTSQSQPEATTHISDDTAPFSIEMKWRTNAVALQSILQPGLEPWMFPPHILHSVCYTSDRGRASPVSVRQRMQNHIQRCIFSTYTLVEAGIDGTGQPHTTLDPKSVVACEYKPLCVDCLSTACD